MQSLVSPGFIAMARGARKGRAKQAGVSVCLRIQIATQEQNMDHDSNSVGESRNEIVLVTTVASEMEQIYTTSPSTYDAALQTSTIKSTYAAIAGPDEGTSLNFVHSQMVNGVKCAKIEPQDGQSEIEYWNSAVLCSVIEANPPLEVIE